MNNVKLTEALAAETEAYSQALKTVVEDARARRLKLKDHVIDEMGLNLAPNMSEEDFFIAIKAFQEISGNLDDIFDQIGFSDKVCQAWVNGSNAPAVQFRSGISHMLLGAAIDYYASTRLTYDLRAFLETWDFPEIIKPRMVIARAALLAKRLTDLDQWNKEVSVRPANALRNEDVETVGELMALTEAHLLRLPNFGRKSFDEIKNFLKGLGLSLNGLTEEERRQVATRRQLNDNAGQPLTTEWCVKIRPDYKDLRSHERLQKRQRGEEPYEWEKADPELILALKEAGITEQTELATAPREVLDAICSGHEGWSEQIPQLLARPGTLDDNYYSGSKEIAGLYLTIPPYLDEGVNVYKVK